MKKTNSTSPRENFLDRLLDGQANRQIRLMFADLLSREDGSLRRDEGTGKWELCLPWLGCQRETALGLAAWDHEQHCAALVTHDLDSFRCWDVTGLIEEIRIA